MQELTAVLTAKREQEYEQHKFMAALKGIDLDKSSGSRSNKSNSWDDFANKTLSKHRGVNQNDIISLTGNAATKAGFGIGKGLEYELVP